MPCKSCLPVYVTFLASRSATAEAITNACMILLVMTGWGDGTRTAVQTLYLGENNIKSLPYNIGRLKKLEELDLSGCKLGMLPDSICQCLELRRLWLSRNRFKAFLSLVLIQSTHNIIHIYPNADSLVSQS